MKRLLASATLSLAAALAPTLGQATPLTISERIFVNTSFPEQTSDYEARASRTITTGGFDDSLGDLLSITLRYDIVQVGEAGAKCIAAAPRTCQSERLDVISAIKEDGRSTGGDNTPVGNVTNNIVPRKGDPVLWTTGAFFRAFEFENTYLPGSAKFGSFSSGGTLEFSISAEYTGRFDPDVGRIRFDSLALLGTVDIEYIYEIPIIADPPAPIPLPASGLLLMAGMGALGLARRRSKES